MKKEKKKTANKPISDQEKERMKKLGLAIMELRAATGESSETFANKYELGRAGFGSIERGKTNVKFVTMVRIFDALGISFDEFFAEWEELAKRGAARKEKEAKKKANKK